MITTITAQCSRPHQHTHGLHFLHLLTNVYIHDNKEDTDECSGMYTT